MTSWPEARCLQCHVGGDPNPEVVASIGEGDPVVLRPIASHGVKGVGNPEAHSLIWKRRTVVLRPVASHAVKGICNPEVSSLN